MSISGLVLYLAPDEREVEAAIAALTEHPAIDLGERIGGRLPVVVETEGTRDRKAMWEWLESLDGVRFITLAYAHFGDALPGPASDTDDHESTAKTPAPAAARA